MRIRGQLLIGSLAFAVVVAGAGVAMSHYAERQLSQALGDRYVAAAATLMRQMDALIAARVEILQVLSATLDLPTIVQDAGASRAAEPNAQATLAAIDTDWKDGRLTPAIQAILDHPLGQQLNAFATALQQAEGAEVFPESYVTDRFGAIVATTGRTSDFMQADDPWYVQALQVPGVWIGDQEYDASCDCYGIDVVVPLVAQNQQRVGILKAVLSSAGMQQRLIHDLGALGLSDHAQAWLIDADGLPLFALADPELRAGGKDLRLAEFATSLESDPVLRQAVADVIKGESGHRIEQAGAGRQLLAFAPSGGFRDFGGMGWSLLIVTDAEQLLAPARRLGHALIGVAGIVVLMAFLMTLLGARTIVRPIERLRAAVVAFSNGAPFRAAELGRGDEIGDLASGFAEMTSVVNQAKERLERAVQMRTAELEQANNLLREEVRERRETAIALESRSREMDRLNAELKAFSQAVASDLQQPLAAAERALTLCCTEPAHRTVVGHELGRMRSLVNDMTALADLAARPMRWERVDLTALAEELLDRSPLASQEPAVEIATSVAPGLHCFGDSELIEILLLNLLDNARAAVVGRTSPHIEVGELVLGGERVFFVRDNGRGLPAEDLDRLFLPFRHGAAVESGEGSGIGLACVRRIAHRHGGCAWAEAPPERGAIIYFVLPDPTGDLFPEDPRFAPEALPGLRLAAP